MKRHEKKALKREEHEARMAERAKRSPEEQVTLLDYLLGEGKGATKERKRLAKQIEANK